MDANRIPALLIAAAVVTSLVIGLVPGLQPPAWHAAVTAVEPPPSALLDALTPESVAEASGTLDGMGSGPATGE